MKLYTAYSANYDHALSSIQAFSRKYPRFAEFLEVRIRIEACVTVVDDANLNLFRIT